MKTQKYSLFLVGIFSMIAPCLATGASKKDMTDTPPPPHVAGQLMIAFKEESTPEQIEKVFQKFQLKKLDKLGSSALYLVEVPASKDLKTLQAELKSEPIVRYSELNSIMKTMK